MSPATMSPRTASVVIPACNEGEMLHMTVESILASPNTIPSEIVIVDDGSTDGSADRYQRGAVAGVRIVKGGGLGVAGARNRGAEQSAGEMIVFLDAHCEVSAHWLDELGSAMAAPDVAIVSPCFTRLGQPHPVGLGVGWASTRLDLLWFTPLEEADSPYEIPLAPGGCQAYPAATFRALGRFDEGFTRWGSEDVEISLRAWLLGYRVVAQPKVRVAHWFRETRAFDVRQEGVAFNLLRMIRLHFTEPRLSSATAVLADAAAPMWGQLQQMLATSDVEDVRTELLAVRERDDAWFCRAFFPQLFGSAVLPNASLASPPCGCGGARPAR